jgi:hypothetical protein
MLGFNYLEGLIRAWKCRLKGLIIPKISTDPARLLDFFIPKVSSDPGWKLTRL